MYRIQTSPLNVQRIGGVTMAENPVSTRPPLARKPHRYKVDEGLDVRFLCHANSTHVLQTLWRGLSGKGKKLVRQKAPRRQRMNLLEDQNDEGLHYSTPSLM